MKGLAGLLGNLVSGMKDDKGLFQGGKQGQAFGRIKDVLGISPKDEFGNKESYDPGMEENRDLLHHARDFAQNFDTTDSGQVGEMQALLNKLGFKDYEGKALTEDSMMGDRTLSALRLLQGGSNDEQQGPGPWSYGQNDSKSWMQRLFGGDSAKQAQRKLFDNIGGGLFQRKSGTGPKEGPGY
jgi:hypothetical protein